MATAPKLTSGSVDTQIADKAKLAELATLIAGIREEVRGRHAAPAGAEIPLANLEPLQRARDAAERQAASIGRVNPRNPGFINDAIQSVKGLVARALGWFVRDQITFNREVIRSLNATVESLQETNRALRSTLAASNAETHAWAQKLQAEARRIETAMAHQHSDSERRQVQLELSFEQRLQAELSQQRTTLIAALDHSARGFEAKTAETAREFELALSEASSASEAKSAAAERAFEALLWAEQKKLWEAFGKARLEYETLIHEELRLVRQRTAIEPQALSAMAGATTATPLTPAPISIDWLQFAKKFRGSEEYIRGTQQMYVERFRAHAPVVDLGCGRGEFLERMNAAGLEATGVEASAELAAICRSKGLSAECANAFQHLEAAAPGSIGGILCSQMVEHLAPADVIRLVQLAHRALRTGGLLAIETPNPECLAIFATHFYLDPSHTKPIPPALMAFYMEEAGFGQIRIERLRPAVETMPSLAALPGEFRESFFGALDYVAFGVKL